MALSNSGRRQVLLRRSSKAWAFVAGDTLYAHPGGDLRLGGVTAAPSMTHLYVWGNMRSGDFIVRARAGGGCGGWRTCAHGSVPRPPLPPPCPD